MLHMVCDLTIAADNAIFGQTGPKVLRPYKKIARFAGDVLLTEFNNVDTAITLVLCIWQVGSFDAGYGSSIMSRLVSPRDKRICDIVLVLISSNILLC